MNINILGIRGIPAAHGGFETFVAKLAPYLRDKGYKVTVYCQDDYGEQGPWEDQWEGIRRIHFCPTKSGPVGTMEFDFACVKHVCSQPGIDLVLGYNTAIFNILQRVRGRKVVMNMDGIEWKRAKWSFPAKAWFYLNEVVGANLCSTAIADHPEIAKHVQSRCFKEPVMIPYGADCITSAPESIVTDMGLIPNQYFISIARIEPENSILEMVKAFAKLNTQFKFFVLGKLEDNNDYHQLVKNAANTNVIFPGAIYDPDTVAALRFHARAYLHGHQVGGTNPSLVEALGAGNPVIAHDNRFNRWVAGEGHFYFRNEAEAVNCMEKVIANNKLVQNAKNMAVERYQSAFKWEVILQQYESVLVSELNKSKY